jgi:hypothetical protein
LFLFYFKKEKKKEEKKRRKKKKKEKKKKGEIPFFVSSAFAPLFICHLPAIYPPPSDRLTPQRGAGVQ